MAYFLKNRIREPRILPYVLRHRIREPRILPYFLRLRIREPRVLSYFVKLRTLNEGIIYKIRFHRATFAYDLLTKSIQIGFFFLNRRGEYFPASNFGNVSWNSLSEKPWYREPRILSHFLKARIREPRILPYFLRPRIREPRILMYFLRPRIREPRILP